MVLFETRPAKPTPPPEANWDGVIESVYYPTVYTSVYGLASTGSLGVSTDQQVWNAIWEHPPINNPAGGIWFGQATISQGTPTCNLQVGYDAFIGAGKNTYRVNEILFCYDTSDLAGNINLSIKYAYVDHVWQHFSGTSWDSSFRSCILQVRNWNFTGIAVEDLFRNNATNPRYQDLTILNQFNLSSISKNAAYTTRTWIPTNLLGRVNINGNTGFVMGMQEFRTPVPHGFSELPNPNTDTVTYGYNTTGNGFKNYSIIGVQTSPILTVGFTADPFIINP